MEKIELKKCYRDYKWKECNISNQEIELFENKHEAYNFLDRGYGCDIQELDSNVVINSFYEKEYEPSRWIRIEEQNDKFGVMSLRTDWHLGGVNRGLVAYRRDITYLDLMLDKDKEKLLDVLTGDEWEDIRIISVTDSNEKYHVDIRFLPYELKKIGIDEWIRENLWIRHKFSKYPENMAASDFKFTVPDFKYAYWCFV